MRIRDEHVFTKHRTQTGIQNLCIQNELENTLNEFKNKT